MVKLVNWFNSYFDITRLAINWVQQLKCCWHLKSSQTNKPLHSLLRQGIKKWIYKITVKLQIIAESQIDACLFYKPGVVAGLGKW